MPSFELVNQIDLNLSSYLTFPRLTIRTCVYLLSSLACGNLSAQNHFWGQQFGAATSLTGGAGVSGNRDNASMFYNPGEMGFIDNPKISLSADLYSLDLINLKNVAGNGINAQSTKIQILPQFAGGCFQIKKLPKLKIFYGVFIKNRENVRYDIIHNMMYDVIKGAPGNEFYKARMEYDHSSTETWAGIGVGYKVTDILSVGVSMFGSYLTVESHAAVSINADALLIDSFNRIIPYTATSNEAATVRMDHISLIWKAGIALDLNRVKLGLAVTLPSAHLWGNGSIYKSIEGYNLNVYSPDTTNVFAHPSFLAADEQKGLDANYKTTPSFALGLTYKTQKFKFDFSVEYFMGLDYYDVIRGKDGAYIQPAAAYGGQPIQDFLVVKTHSVPIINLGLGASYKIKEKVKLLAGFYTDFNNRMNFAPYLPGINYNSMTPSYWHLMHFSLGSSIHRGAHDVTFGVSYAFGLAADRNQAINFTEPIHDLWLRGTTNNSLRTNVNSINLIIGYTYFFRGSPRTSEKSIAPPTDW
jgi:hypothetical protein